MAFYLAKIEYPPSWMESDTKQAETRQLSHCTEDCVLLCALLASDTKSSFSALNCGPIDVYAGTVPVLPIKAQPAPESILYPLE